MVAAGEPAIFIDTENVLSEMAATHEGVFLAFETLSDVANQLIEDDESWLPPSPAKMKKYMLIR